jgi:hypothetical protein
MPACLPVAAVEVVLREVVVVVVVAVVPFPPPTRVTRPTMTATSKAIERPTARRRRK